MKYVLVAALFATAVSPALATDNRGGGGGGVGVYLCTLMCEAMHGDCDNSDPTSVLKSIDFECVRKKDACLLRCSTGGGSGGGAYIGSLAPSGAMSPLPRPHCDDLASTGTRAGA